MSSTKDAVYNGFFANQVATVGKDGRLVGDKFNAQSQQKLTFIGRGGDSFVIQVVATGKYVVPQDQYVGTSGAEYTWHLVAKSSPLSGYYFETNDRQQAWYLPNGANNTPIELKPVDDLETTDDKEKAEWVWRQLPSGH